MPTIFTKIAVTDGNDLTKTEVIANVAEGLDGATSFGYSNSYEKLSILDMQKINKKVTHTIELIGLPSANVSTATIDQLTNPDTDAKVALIGTDLAAVAQEPVKLEWVKKYTDGTAWKLKATFETVPYREQSTQRKGGGFHVGHNLMQLYSFGDVDSDGVANGFTSVGFSNESFSNGEQTVEDSTTGGEQLFRFDKMFFPFEGESIVFAADINSITDSGHQLALRLDYLDSGGTLLSADETVFSSTGRKQVNGVIPPGAVHVRPSIVSTDTGSASGTTVLTFADPSLRVDGNSGFVAY